MKDVTNAQCYSCSLASVCPDRETFLNVYAHSDEVMCKCGNANSNENTVTGSTTMEVVVQHRFLDGPGLEEIYKGLGMNAPSSCALVPGNRCPLHWRHPYDSPIMGHWHRPLGYISAICQSPVSHHELGRRPFIPKDSHCNRCLHGGMLHKKPNDYNQLGGTDYSTFFTGVIPVNQWSKIPLDLMLGACAPTNLMDGYVVDRNKTRSLFEFTDDPSTPVVIYWRYTKGKPVPVPAEAPKGYYILETPEEHAEMFRLGITFGDMTAVYPGMERWNMTDHNAHVDIAWVESGNGIWSDDQKKILVVPGEGYGVRSETVYKDGHHASNWVIDVDGIDEVQAHRLLKADTYVEFKLPFGSIVHICVTVPENFMLFMDMIRIMNPYIDVALEMTSRCSNPPGATAYYLALTPTVAEPLYFTIPIIYKKYQVDPVNFPLMEYKGMVDMNVRWGQYYCLMTSQDRFMNAPVVTYPRAFQKLDDLTPNYTSTVPHTEKEVEQYMGDEPDNIPPIEGGYVYRKWFDILGYTHQLQGRSEYNPFITIYEPNKCAILSSDVPEITVPPRTDPDGTVVDGAKYKDPSYLVRPAPAVFYGKTTGLDEGLAAVYTLNYEMIRDALMPNLTPGNPKLRVDPIGWRKSFPPDDDVRDQIFFGEVEPDTTTEVPIYQKTGNPIIEDAILDLGTIPYNGKDTIQNLVDKIDEALAPVMDSDEFEMQAYLIPLRREFMGIHILDGIVYNAASIRATIATEIDEGPSGPDEEFGGYDGDLPFTMGGEIDETETIITQNETPDEPEQGETPDVPEQGGEEPEEPKEDEEPEIDPGMNVTVPPHTFEELEPYKFCTSKHVDASKMAGLRPEETYQLLIILTPKNVVGFHEAQYCYVALSGRVQFGVVEVPVTIYGEEPECICQCEDCKIYRKVTRRKSEYSLCPGDDDILLCDELLGDPSAPVTMYYFGTDISPWRLAFYHISEITYRQSLEVKVEYNELVKRYPQFLTTHTDTYEIDGGEIVSTIAINLPEDTSLLGLSAMSGSDFKDHVALVKIDEQTGQAEITENVNTADFSIAGVYYYVDDGKCIDVTFVARRDMKFIVSYEDGNKDKNASCSRCKGYVDMKEYPWITWTPSCDNYKSY